VEDRFNTLEVLKHVFTNINFNGKISRTEDYRKLKAHIDDLFNEQLSFQNSAESDLDHSHFGFPDKDDDILQVMMHTLP
jgi:plasmid replication initiation protein